MSPRATDVRPAVRQRLPGSVPAFGAPGCTNPGGAFTFERDGRIYEFCSEGCRARFESTFRRQPPGPFRDLCERLLPAVEADPADLPPQDMVDAGPQSPSITGHIVLLPSTNPHRTLRALRPLGLVEHRRGGAA